MNNYEEPPLIKYILFFLAGVLVSLLIFKICKAETRLYLTKDEKIFDLKEIEGPEITLERDICDDIENNIIKYACESCLERYNETEWYYFDELIKRESGYNPEAQNPTSTAYGIMQFLDSTWAGTGIEKTSDPIKQIEAGFIYIESRYKTPAKAIEWHNKINWY